MSVFGKLFRGKKGNEPKVRSLLEPQTTGEAIQNLRETEEMLMNKQDFLQKKIVSEMVVARKNAKTNKRMALNALEKKKFWDKYLHQIDGTLITIEQHRKALGLEGANTNTAVLQTMKSAADALKNAHKGMDNVDFDEDELEAELNELEMEGYMEEQEKLEAELP